MNFKNFHFNFNFKNYLEKYKFGNTRREDLWIELEKVFLSIFSFSFSEYIQYLLNKAAIEDSKLSNLSLTDIMNTWTLQMGHPLITIERINEKSIKISQSQFLLDPTAPPIEESKYKF